MMILWFCEGLKALSSTVARFIGSNSFMVCNFGPGLISTIPGYLVNRIWCMEYKASLQWLFDTNRRSDCVCEATKAVAMSKRTSYFQG